jgi:hypothetical protein
MAEPKWRGDEADLCPRRQYIRDNCPEGEQGFVAEDVDLLLRYFGPRGIDPWGKMKLIEFKVANGVFMTAQQRTFGLLDRILKTSCEAERYLGFYLVYTETELWDDLDVFTVNGWDLTKQQFNSWLKNELHIDPIDPYGNVVQSKVWNWHNGPFLEGSNLES